MSLFQTGVFQLHSGQRSQFKIDCDALTDDDINTVALMLVHRLPMFYDVQGVPTGGLRLAEAMKSFRIPFQPMRSDKLLIVDDVFSTGTSMNDYRDAFHDHRLIIGAVIFARAETPNWVTPLFRLTP